MSLTARERRALATIGRQLGRSDPVLAALLTGSRADGGGRRLPSMSVRRWPPTGELVRLLAVATGLALVLGLAIAGVLSTHPARSLGRELHNVTGVVPPGAGPVGAYPASSYP